MQCPNCRETEAGQWLFAGGEFGRSIQDEGVEVVEIVNSEAFTSLFHLLLFQKFVQKSLNLTLLLERTLELINQTFLLFKLTKEKVISNKKKAVKMQPFLTLIPDCQLWEVER